MRLFKKILRISGYLLITLVMLSILLLQVFFNPKSDKKIQETFQEENADIFINHKEFKGFKYRLISTRKEIDTTLPTVVFVHGSPGTMLDFIRYFLDEDLNSKANLVAYERVGYGLSNSGDVQKIGFDTEMLNEITAQFEVSKTILVGYSYGGPIALASKKEYKKVVLLAPAVYSEVEPMFWFVNFYKWKLTRWLVPKMLKSASVEKIQHQEDLRSFENHWNENPSEIHAIHGDNDWIVLKENSLFIQEQFDADKFELVTLKGAGHDLVWTRFLDVKKELIKVIEE